MKKEEAVSVAGRFIADRIGPDMIHPGVGRIVIEEEFVTEHESAWVVPFNSAAFLDSADFDKACIPSVIVVPKGGAPAFLPPTSPTVDEFLAEESSRRFGG